MEITKIAARKISDGVALQIKEQIISGKLRPGQKLPSSRELAERFQVGRSTIREALSALKAMGLLETHQGEGSFVQIFEAADIELPTIDKRLISKQTLLELLEARKSLEVSIAGIAAQKRTEKDMNDLQQILEKMKHDLGNELGGEQADIAFHMTLAKASHNSIMIRLLDTISSTMEVAIRETRRLQMYANPSAYQQLSEDHERIFVAIVREDAEQAQAEMKKHLLHVEQRLMPFVAGLE